MINNTLGLLLLLLLLLLNSAAAAFVAFGKSASSTAPTSSSNRIATADRADADADAGIGIGIGIGIDGIDDTGIVMLCCSLCLSATNRMNCRNKPYRIVYRLSYRIVSKGEEEEKKYVFDEIVGLNWIRLDQTNTVCDSTSTVRYYR